MLYGRPAAIVLAAISMGIVFTIVLEPTRTHADFFTFFDSARQLRAGGDPYLGEPLRQGAGYNLNPPSVLLLFLPFAWLPLLPGFLLWTVINTAAYALSAWLIARHVAPRYGVEVVAAVLVSQVTFLGLQLGQHVGLLMGVLTAAWLADRRQRFFVAGALLGGAMAVKLFLGVFLFYAIWQGGYAVALTTGLPAET